MPFTRTVKVQPRVIFMLFGVVLLLSLSWSVWAQEASTAEAAGARCTEATTKAVTGRAGV